MKRLFILFFCLFSLSLFAADDTLRIGIIGDVSSLDPHKALDTISSAVLYNVYDNLVTFRGNSLEIAPALAISWTHSDDWRTWTYRIRPNVHFHDGTPLTADVVVKSFSDVPNFDATVTKVDAMTVTFTLPSGNAHFNDYIAQPYYAIVPIKRSSTPIGTGPFIFKSREKGKNVIIEANPDWWSGKVSLKRAEFIVFPSEKALLKAMADQEIDLAEWLTSRAALTLKNHPYIHVESTLGSNVALLSLNITHPPLNNVKVREAIAHAVDVVSMTRTFFPGASGAPASTIIPPTLFKTMIPPFPYNPKRAKQLLKESRADTSKPLRLLEAWAPRPYMPDPHGIALQIKKYLEAVGLHIKVDIDPQHYFERIRSGDVDLCMNGWIADNGDPAEFISANLHSDSIGHNNVSRWSNPSFDKLLNRAKVQDSYKLKMTLNKALQMVKKDVPAIPLFWGAQSAAWNTRVKDYSVHPSSQMILYRVSLRSSNATGK